MRTPAVGSSRGTRGVRLRAHATEPLYRNAYLLLLGSVVGSGLGFVFWAVAARHYSATAVGRNSAAVAAMIVVSGISQLGLNAVLVRYIPAAGSSVRSLVLLSYGATTILAAAASVVAAVTSSVWAPPLSFLGNDSRWLVTFVVSTVAWTIFSLQDSVMTGLRQAHWVPIENSLFSALKIVLLIIVAGATPLGGIFLAWNIPVLLSLIPVNVLIFRRLIPRYAGRAHKRWNSRIAFRFASANYLGSIFFLGSTTLLPIIVAHESGPTATAYFFIPWTIATALQLIAVNMTTSMTVEVALDETKLREYCRRVTLHTMRLVVPITVALVLGAPYFLRIFGKDYASEGATLLRLLAIATIPNVIVALGLAVARLEHAGRAVLSIQGAVCILTLGLSLVLLPSVGISGVGVASLVSQTVVAAALLVGMLRMLRFSRASAGGQANSATEVSDS
jgi:O-antigen/teichoic acid export membrane protein